MTPAEWASANRERGLLIDKDIAGTLTSEEHRRLDELNAAADEHLRQVAPRPEQAELFNLGSRYPG